MRRKGFSIIELVVVMAIVAIISVIAFISLNPYKEVRIDALAKKVEADVNYTKLLAMSTAKWHGIEFDLAQNQYTIYRTNGVTDTPVKDPVNRSRDYIVSIDNELPGATISNVSIPGGGDKVEFIPLGVPYDDYNGGALTAEAVVTLSYQGLTKDIHIAPSTARVYIQ